MFSEDQKNAYTNQQFVKENLIIMNNNLNKVKKHHELCTTPNIYEMI